MAYVQLDAGGNVTGIFANSQPGNPNFATIPDQDPRIAAFLNPPSAQLQTKLAAGLAVTSTSTPALSATYALDALTLDQIGSVARDAAAGLGLPGGLASFAYPDIASTPRTFTAAQIEALYKAMRDYVFAASTTAAALAAGQTATWPTASATIP